MKRPRAGGGLLALLALFACQGGCSDSLFDFERMLQQPRYDPYAASRFFADGRAMRVPPEGTLPRREPDAASADLQPAPDRALLERGRDRFEVFCAACHGLDGSARTPVARAMRLRPPPSLHEARIRALDAADVHRAIEQGYGLMPSYAPLLGGAERWAVAYYVQVLQLSRRVALSELPPELRARAEQALSTAPEQSR